MLSVIKGDPNGFWKQLMWR